MTEDEAYEAYEAYEQASAVAFTCSFIEPRFRSLIHSKSRILVYAVPCV